MWRRRCRPSSKWSRGRNASSIYLAFCTWAFFLNHQLLDWIPGMSDQTVSSGRGWPYPNLFFDEQSCFGQNLIYGGAQTCIFSLVVAFLTQGIVTLGLAELASAYPVSVWILWVMVYSLTDNQPSGGQYHFCFILSPPGSRRYAAYIVGWITMLAWWIVTCVLQPRYYIWQKTRSWYWRSCSGISLSAVVLNGIVNFWHQEYIGNQWETYLIYLAVSVVTSESPNRHSGKMRTLPLTLPSLCSPSRLLLFEGFRRLAGIPISQSHWISNLVYRRACDA